MHTVSSGVTHIWMQHSPTCIPCRSRAERGSSPSGRLPRSARSAFDQGRVASSLRVHHHPAAAALLHPLIARPSTASDVHGEQASRLNTVAYDDGRLNRETGQSVCHRDAVSRCVPVSSSSRHRAVQQASRPCAASGRRHSRRATRSPGEYSSILGQQAGGECIPGDDTGGSSDEGPLQPCLLGSSLGMWSSCLGRTRSVRERQYALRCQDPATRDVMPPKEVSYHRCASSSPLLDHLVGSALALGRLRARAHWSLAGLVWLGLRPTGSGGEGSNAHEAHGRSSR